MIISIVGSVCAGKTTLAQALQDTLGLPFHPIGEFRNRYRDEVKAWQAFGELLKVYDRPAKTIEDCVVVVTTGLNTWYQELTEHIEHLVTIKLVAPREVLLERARGRPDDDDGYFPYSITRPVFIEQAEDLIEELEADLTIDTGQHSREETAALAVAFLLSKLSGDES